MHRYKLLCFLLLCFFTFNLQGQSTSEKADTIFTSAGGNGMKIKYHGNVYVIYYVDLRTSMVQFHLKDKSGENYHSLGKLVNDKTVFPNPQKVKLVTNAGIFAVNRLPLGLFIENGKQVTRIDTSNPPVNDNFHMKPNGVFALTEAGAFITRSESYPAMAAKNKVKYATQSGPMLVVNGAIHSSFTPGSKNLNIRSGAGTVTGTTIVFAISEGTTNFYDFAALFKNVLKCNNALYLDGAISLMHIPEMKMQEAGGDFGPLISVSDK